MSLKTQGKIYVVLLFGLSIIFYILTIVKGGWLSVDLLITYHVMAEMFGLAAIIIAIFTPKNDGD